MGTFTFDPAGAAAAVTLSGSDPDICIDLIEGFVTLPDVRGKDWIVPGLDSEQPGNRRLGKLILPSAGYIRGSGATPVARREDFLTNVSAVMAALDPSLGVGVITLAAGYLGLPVGSEATISARVRNVSPGKMQDQQSFQLWTIEWECYDTAFEIGS